MQLKILVGACDVCGWVPEALRAELARRYLGLEKRESPLLVEGEAKNKLPQNVHKE